MRHAVHTGQDDDAARQLERLPDGLRGDPELLFLRAVVLERRHRFRDAIEFALQSLGSHEHPETMLLLASCHHGLGETEKALRWCDRAERAWPVVGPAVGPGVGSGGGLGVGPGVGLGVELATFLRAKILEGAGRFEEATGVLAPLAAAYDAAGRPYPLGLGVEWSKLLVQNGRCDEAISLIDRTLAGPGISAIARADQLFLKAKAADRKGDYDLAFACASEANSLERLPFDPGLYEEQVSALIENWSRERVRDFPLAECDSELPVFVAGMPRSGTSLIDRIIDAHPKAAGVGELSSIEQFAIELGREYDPEQPPPDCFGRLGQKQWTRVATQYVRELTRLAPRGAERVVNKALGNNKLVGLIARLFPKTRIIHAVRDPRDVAISCFMGRFNNRFHPWSTRLDWTAAAWEQSRRMMQHWRDTLDVPILEVRYERLVTDPEPEFRRIIEFLGLEWDDRCMSFHATRRTVRTLSYDQVNRPLYTTSAGRHAHYAKHLAGVEFPTYQ